MTSRSKIVVACGALALLVFGGAGAFYSVRGGAGNSVCSAAATKVETLRPLAKGEVAAVEVAKQPALLPDLAFNGPDGRPTTLSAMRGKTVLVNLWATWCLPCLTEMPALDALQGALGGPDLPGRVRFRAWRRCPSIPRPPGVRGRGWVAEERG